MSRPNFAAWEIDASEFDHSWTPADRLRFFARYAVLAPSGHNTQPWFFEFSGDQMFVSANPACELPHSGLIAGEPIISVGAAVEVLSLAAEGFGYELNISVTPSGEHALATVQLGGQCARAESLLDAITSRFSNRGPYSDQLVPERLLDELRKLDLPGAGVLVTTERSEIEFFAEETETATKILMGDPGFRKELSRWVRNNRTGQFDGMPGYVQEMPLLPSLVGSAVIRRFDISKTQARKDAGRVRASPALMFIAVDSADAAGFFDAGRLYARLAVRAQAQGLATSGIAAAVLEPGSRERVAEQLGIDRQPIAVMRIGFPTVQARPSPRHPLADVTISRPTA